MWNFSTFFVMAKKTTTSTPKPPTEVNTTIPKKKPTIMPSPTAPKKTAAINANPKATNNIYKETQEEQEDKELVQAMIEAEQEAERDARIKRKELRKKEDAERREKEDQLLLATLLNVENDREKRLEMSEKKRKDSKRKIEIERQEEEEMLNLCFEAERKMMLKEKVTNYGTPCEMAKMHDGEAWTTRRSPDPANIKTMTNIDSGATTDATQELSTSPTTTTPPPYSNPSQSIRTSTNMLLRSKDTQEHELKPTISPVAVQHGQCSPTLSASQAQV